MNRFLNRLSSLFLLILAIFSMIALLIDSFALQADQVLYLWLGAACVLLWVAGSFPRGIWIGMPLSGLLLYAAFRLLGRNTGAQLQDLLDHFTGAYYSHVVHPGSVYSYAHAASSHNLILLFLGFLMGAYLITALTARNARISLSMLGTVPIFIACILVNGTPPALACAGLLLFWFLILVTGGSYQINGNTGRSLVCAILPLCLVLGGLLTLHKPEDYVFDAKNAQLLERFERLSQYFELLTGRSSPTQIFSSDPELQGKEDVARSRFQSSWDGAENEMQLDHPYDLEHAELKVLQVRAETDGPLYLRTKSYGDYTGTGWAAAKDLLEGSSLPLTAFAAAQVPTARSRALEIRTYLDLDALCLPYYSAVSGNSDSFVPSEGKVNYRVTFTDYRGQVSALRLPADAAENEALYRRYAYENYTQLPDSTRRAAQVICAQADFNIDTPEGIEQVANYIRLIGTYDLQTEVYPSDDYAIYFLNESHRGYCIHYATAATVLYRALGLPARVVEGFLVDARANTDTDVIAGNAHAWVEVYWSGVGWIPVEVTTEAGFATQAESPLSTPMPTPPPSSEEPSASSGPSQNGGPGPNPTQTPDTETETEQPDLTAEPEAAPAAPVEKRPFPWSLLLCVLALPLLLLLWYAFARMRYLSQIRSSDGRRAAIACWRYAKRALPSDQDLPVLLVQTAEKAAFSPHVIRREELEQCRAVLQQSLDALYPKLRPLQKCRIRFLLGMK